MADGVEVVVTGGPAREARAVLGDGEPVLTLTFPHPVAVAVARGELDPDVGLMRGEIKVAGDLATLFDLLPVAADADLREALSGLL